MDALLYVRLPNVVEYAKLGVRKFAALPRVDEFVTAEWEGTTRHFQVLAVHHNTEKEAAIEIYGIQTEPPWEVRKGRAIGFGPSGN